MSEFNDDADGRTLRQLKFDRLELRVYLAVNRGIRAMIKPLSTYLGRVVERAETHIAEDLDALDLVESDLEMMTPHRPRTK